MFVESYISTQLVLFARSQIYLSSIEMFTFVIDLQFCES